MNQNENDLHVKLCADLLGELPANARAELEAALAKDPALRAQRERLAATIGLVESTLGGAPAESMPADARAELMASATSVARPAPKTRLMLVTAAFATAAAAGLLVWVARMQSQPVTPAIAPVAQGDRVQYGLEKRLRESGGEKAWKEGEERASKDSPPQADPSPTAASEANQVEKGSFEGGALEQRRGEVTKKQDGTNKELQDAKFAEADGKAGDPALHDLFDKSKAAPKSEEIARIEALETEAAKNPPADTVPPPPLVDSLVRQEPAATPASDSFNVAMIAPVPPATPVPQPEIGAGAGGQGGGRVGGGQVSGFSVRKVDGRGKGGPGLANEKATESKAGAPGAAAPPHGEQYKFEGGEATWRAGLDGEQAASARDDDAIALLDGTRDAALTQNLGLLGNAFADEEDRRARTPSADEVIDWCRRRPSETPSMMYFRFWGDHAFERAAVNAQSTFGVDVDTASWPLVRGYLERGLLPPKEAVRTEEFLNWFKADAAAPAGAAGSGPAFSIALDGGRSRYGAAEAKDARLLRVVIRGKDVAKEERAPLKLTCVIDVSGSMQQENRLELVKNSLRLLVAGLEPKDALAIVTFNTTGQLVLPMTSLSDRAAIESAIAPLTPNGSTNAQAGISIGYAEAGKRFDPECMNRVVMFSDGVANTGQTDQDAITAEVAKERERGILLNTYGVGMGNHNDVLLEQLADKGDGVCSYIDDADEAKRQLVERFSGAMITIARDVKVQVEFDPTQVERWRLLGYENRHIANQDFRNDAVDAGEIGAGHQVTALYEIEPGPEFGAGARPVATVRLRWKPPVKAPGPDAATETERSIAASALAADWNEQAFGLKRAALVAQFAEFLRRSTHARGDSIDDLAIESHALAAASGDKDLTEFASLVDRAKGLIPQLPPQDPLVDALDAIRKNRVLRAELEDLAKARDQSLVDELERQNRELEARIRDLLRERLGK